MAIASNRHCASCIGALSFRIAIDIKSAVLISEVGSIGRRLILSGSTCRCHLCSAYDAACSHCCSLCLCKTGNVEFCACVCQLVTTVRTTEMAETLKLPFGAWTRLGARDHLLGGGLDPSGVRHNLGVSLGPLLLHGL